MQSLSLRPSLIAGMVLCLGWTSTAHAQISFDDDTPRAFSIQKRPYRLGHEFELGTGILPLDAFYVGAVVAFSYTYHLSDFWAWEIVSLDYSSNVGTGLQTNLNDDYSLQPDELPPRIVLFGATSLVVKPLFGKLTWRNRSIVYSETYFTLGLGPHMLVSEANINRGSRTDWVPAVNLGIGWRFWQSDVFSIRFGLRDYLIFDTWVPENSLLIMLSGSFNFFTRESQP